MSTHKLHGRRRAAAPAAVAAPVPQTRPRDAVRAERRRRGPVRQAAGLARVTGAGQKAGMALAATGLVLTVAIPSTGAAVAEEPPKTAKAPLALVSTPLSAKVEFSRTGFSTTADPDGRLKQIMSTASGSVTPASAKGSLAAPLAHMTEASPFGQRISPITGEVGEFHRGEDFAAGCGTDVHAAASGKVTFAGWHPYGGGNRVVIDHGNGLETTYNHLSSFSVHVGQEVSRGELIALSGTTGASTGCHLHFEVMVNGDVVDPAGWL